MKSILEIAKTLSERVADMSGIFCVCATSEIDESAVLAGESDVDLFVFGERIPPDAERLAAYGANSVDMGVCRGGAWGTGDILHPLGADVMFMYFTLEETRAYAQRVLAGELPDRIGGFYPMGRLATLRNMVFVAGDPAISEALKAPLTPYPPALAERLTEYHLARCTDEEGLARTRQRREVLYAHSVFEDGLDHLLQALFAMNQTYFPGRKRTLGHLSGFSRAPQDCGARLLRLIELAAREETLPEAVAQWTALVRETRKIAGA